MNRHERIVSLYRELLKMPEYEMTLELKGLDVSLYVFQRNFASLRSLLVMLKEPGADALFPPSNFAKLRPLHLEMVRRLHNFVAAATSLIEHVRALRAHWREQRDVFPSFAALEAKIQRETDLRFANDSLSRFVNQLRNFATHRELPRLLYRSHVGRSHPGIQRSVRLPLEFLRAWDGWTGPARAYLDSCREDIDLLELVTAYYDKVVDFHGWLSQRLAEAERSDFSSFIDMSDELVLLELEDRLDMSLANPADCPLGEGVLFHKVFDLDDFHALATLPPDSPQRGNRAIGLLERDLPVSDTLKNKIRTVYKRRGFCADNPVGSIRRDED